MSRFIWVFLAGLCAVAACSPTFNWREIRLANTPLKIMLPCQPDHGSRKLPLLDAEVELHMSGCEAGTSLFAVAWVEVKDARQTAMAMAQWQAAMLANMQAAPAQMLDFTPKGGVEPPKAMRLTATGRRADGQPVVAQGAWFARGSQVFHAVVYADKLSPEVVETFFAGLELQ